MLRSFLISLSKAGWAQRTITGWGFAWRMASRFVAGETPEDAIRAVRTLNERGILATLDHLGENTSTPQEAEQAVADILAMLAAIEHSGVHAGVSIKLSQIGLALDAGLCRRNLERILAAAQAQRNFVRIDMEDSPFTQATLDLFLEMRAQGFEDTGLVIQSYLYRSEEDVRRLVAGGARVRLVKGAYIEPAEIAFPRKADVDRSFDHLVELLLDASRGDAAPPLAADGKTPPLAAIATHDVRRIDHARAHAAQLGLPKAALEFQMLYGIRRDLQEALVREGYPVRVYVPYGTHWYPYFMRRLAERPANLWFFVTNFFRK